MENGIPQGSPLSCTLFSIAINEIATGIDDNVSHCIYVDDVTLFCSGKTIGDISRKIQKSINIIHKNGANTKPKYVHFCRLRKPHNDPTLYLGQQIIRGVTEVKFLGLIFDSKLTWRSHIANLIVRCRKVLNIFKTLAHTVWGAEPKTLLKVYQALVLSRIDYGCQAYSSARNSMLKQLDTIHHAGIRYCIGAFPTSPVESLYCESGLSSLQIRRNRLIGTYFLKTLANPSNPNNEFIWKSSELYKTRPTITRPAGARFISLLESLNFPLPEILIQSAQQQTINITDNILSRICNCNRLIIFMDGSKTDNGVGCAFVVKGRQYSWTLHKYWSVYSAEHNVGGHLKNIRPSVLLQPTHFSLNRINEVKMHRLRIGHTKLTHCHLLQGRPPPSCDECETQLTVQHILCNYPKFEIERRTHGVKHDVASNLSSKECVLQVLKYLKEINIFEEL
ncbi:hypothetical protein NQ315_010982 [Exocentrus adspersus]|uniref:Reverse transcriptase domain-containing protein n=1 Tax=Exocentrus adspersus TaxID=1586481 RepID=A0AAV8VGJ6_9CUCU|nr:hypothetical protein NQ315_010982 [Exocentrus adspersus]